MAKATIVIHLPAHRRVNLASEHDTRDAEQAYDQNIAGYVQFLQEQAALAGYDVRTDHADTGPILRIDECSHADKKGAYRWLNEQPDIWNWMPRAVVS